MNAVSLALRPARPNWRPTASCWAIRSSRSLRAWHQPHPHRATIPSRSLRTPDPVRVGRAGRVWRAVACRAV